MIRLRPFQEVDIPLLVSWIPDARFLLQWAGPQYKFPLDEKQILQSMERASGEEPESFLFTGITEQDGAIIGHAQLIAVDYIKRTAMLGRVLIGDEKSRRKGFGRALVAAVLNYGFTVLRLSEINLGVFDFNKSAIECYRKLDFVEYEFKENARQFEGDPWNLVMMRISSQAWRVNCCQLENKTKI